jgi:alpha-glucosidase (family GH31 glycosyl hydrolase)
MPNRLCFKYFGRTFFPPYWALGFQISRYGYENLDAMKKVLDRFDANEIPLVNYFKLF